MNDQDRRWALPESIDLYAECEREMAQHEWSEMRRDGWLSAAPTVPSVDDVRKALALLAIISGPEQDDLADIPELDEDESALDWLH